MADDEQFSLCWNNFNSNLSAGFHESLCRGDLVDVTLAAEGQFVKAHRLVLSVCSPYFRKMFTQMPANQHAFVFLKDVSHTALKDLIQFMYCGEVNVKQEALPAFISTAEALQIKGLTDSDPPPSQSPAEPSTPTPQQIQQIASPRVRQRTSATRSYKIETVDDSGDDKQAAQIVIQTTTAPPPQQTSIAQQTQHLQQPQSQSHVVPQQMNTAATTTTVVTHKRPARSIGSGPHIKRTKSTIDPLDTADATTGTQQIAVQTAVVSAGDAKTQVQQAQEPEYIDLPIELPTKSEPDYTEDAGEVEGGENETTYVEDDSYGELRYDESYFTENEDAAGNATATTQATSGTVAGGGASATTSSKALVKQQQSSFPDTSYVETAEQTNNDAQGSLKAAKPKTLASGTKRTVTTLHTAEPSTSKAATTVIRRPRNKAKLKADLEKNKLMNKIAETIKKHNGQPALYASTTKGGMKLIYDGHHFRYSFRKGQYSIFQCCYKESKEECKVRVVSDQKRVYPLDGEHVHFMQATDRSVTSMTFEPGEAIEEMELQQQKQKEEQEHFLSDDTYDLQLVTITEDGNIVPLHESGQVVVKSDVDDAPTTPTVVSVTEPADRKPDQAALDAIDADDFREKIKRRLQKALLGKKK